MIRKLFFAGGMLLGTTLAFAQPDFNGLWFPAGFDRDAPRLEPGHRDMPWNEQAQKLADAYVAAFDITDEPGGFCVKPGLPRSIWGAPFPVEIVQTDSFINMLWEGYFQYRKIYLEGHPRPEHAVNIVAACEGRLFLDAVFGAEGMGPMLSDENGPEKARKLA